MSETLRLQLADIHHRLHHTLPMAHLECTVPPGLDNIQLALINADFPLGPLPQEIMHAVIAKPAYWAFCWGSGLALAQHLIDTPAVVKGRRVADIGSGSGVVAIAAARAGAAQVWACDNDDDALAACRANAQLNQVELIFSNNISSLPDNLDIVLMADVLYDRSNFALITQAKALAPELLIADSRVHDVEDADFRVLHARQALTYPNLGEFDEFKDVRFFTYAEKSAVPVP